VIGRRGLPALCLAAVLLLAGGAQAARSDLDLVSRSAGATGAKANGFSDGAAVSGDGRFVAFWSAASNLDPADINSIPDVYVRDMQTNTNVLVTGLPARPGPRGTAFPLHRRSRATGASSPSNRLPRTSIQATAIR
jgi:hypothetical protein